MNSLRDRLLIRKVYLQRARKVDVSEEEIRKQARLDPADLFDNQ